MARQMTPVVLGVVALTLMALAVGGCSSMLSSYGTTGKVASAELPSIGDMTADAALADARWVPPHLHAEGAYFADPVEPLPEEPASPAVATAPVDPMLRHQDILAAIELVATRNQREDFTAAGAPHLGALSTILGWKPEARERDQLWARFQVDKDD